MSVIRSSTSSNTQSWSNWAQIHSCRPVQTYHPYTEHELKEILATARAQDPKPIVRIIGSGHSPNSTCCVDDDINGWHISLSNFNKIVNVDSVKKCIEVQAGVTLDRVVDAGLKHGLQFPFLPSILEQTVGGAIATATHGSGIQYGSLSSYVVHIKVMSATDGSVLDCSEEVNPDVFYAARCGLGVVGIVLAVTFTMEPSANFIVRANPSTYEEVRRTYLQKVRSFEHYKFLWVPHTAMCQEWTHTRTAWEPATPNQPAGFFHKLIYFHALEFLLFVSVRFWHRFIVVVNALYAWMCFRGEVREVKGIVEAFTFDCLFKQRVAEYSVPVEKCFQALDAIKRVLSQNKLYAHPPVEVRFVGSENGVWMSPNYGRDSVMIGIIMYRPYGRDSAQAMTYLASVEEELRRVIGVDVRPHWAKYSSMDSVWYARAYPQYSAFLRVADKMDKDRLLRNRWAKSIFP